MFLSICITVYNQIDIVRANILEIMKCKLENIEIVISDDCSTDPIENMVSEFHDSRIKYYRTSLNKSHDNNIINGLKNCQGEYIFLFRSKDVIIADRIETVISTIHSNPDASYFLFSALDENYKERMTLKDEIYHRYGEAQIMHQKLLIHPSGQIYKKSCLRMDLYERYINEYFPKNNGCDVHNLIRMDLALKGDFVTSSCYAWRYAYTFNSKDKSVIVTSGKLNIYSPYYQYQRYACEFGFVDNELPEVNKKLFLEQIIKKYGWSIIPFFMVINHDEKYNRHYNSKPVPFYPYRELKNFKKISIDMINNMKYFDKKDEKKYLRHQLNIIRFYYIPIAAIKKTVYSSKLLIIIWHKIHRSKTM